MEKALSILLIATFALAVQSAAPTCAEWNQRKEVTVSGTTTQVIESPHPYCANAELMHHYTFTSTNIGYLRFTADSQNDIGRGDYLRIHYFDGYRWKYRTIRGDDALDAINGPIKEFFVEFYSDAEEEAWGYKFDVIPMNPCADFVKDKGTTVTDMSPLTVASPHFYCHWLNVKQSYKFTDPSVKYLTFDFDDKSSWNGTLTIDCQTASGKTRSKRMSYFSSSYKKPVVTDCVSFDLTFETDDDNLEWGYEFTVTPSATTVAGADVETFFQDEIQEAAERVTNIFKTAA